MKKILIIAIIIILAIVAISFFVKNKKQKEALAAQEAAQPSAIGVVSDIVGLFSNRPGSNKSSSKTPVTCSGFTNAEKEQINKSNNYYCV